MEKLYCYFNVKSCNVAMKRRKAMTGAKVNEI